MMLIFLLLFFWSLNAMNDDDNDLNDWMAMLNASQQAQPVEPAIATENKPIPASTTIITIPAAVTAIAFASAQQVQQETAQPSSTTTATSAPYRNMRRQEQRVPYPKSQTRWVAPDESVSRSGNYVMRCFYPECPWGIVYKWPEDEEEFRYVQLLCTENVWLHCHTVHWSLKKIGAYVVSQFHNPTRRPQKPQ